MNRARALLFVTLLCALPWACTEGPGPTANSRAVAVGIVPNFQVDPALYATEPIDRIRLTARHATTNVVVGRSDQSVSPTATQWSLSLGIDLGGAASLQVFVEAELLSSGSVVWSGRLGPFTVPSTMAHALDVYPGPLDNQDVLGVDIPDPPTELVVGTSASVSADLTLEPGSTASPVLLWASTSPLVATVTGSGSTVTVTALSIGTADIIATAGPAYDEFSVEVVPLPAFDVEWLGMTTDWSLGSNWSTGQVPLASDNVLVPATGNDPQIATDVQVADLTVEVGATVTLASAVLEVSGDLVVDGTLSGAPGSVALSGAGASVRGSVETPVTVTGSVAASGPFTAGTLDIEGAGASFDVNGQQVSSLGGLSSDVGGVLRMTSVTGQLDVAGAAWFGGASTFGLLTAGTLRVGGDFTATDNSPTSFAATGSHTVVFEGTASRTIMLQQPGQAEQHFQHVTFDLTGRVTAASELMAWGVIDVVNGTVDASSQTVSVGEALYDPNGGLSYAALRLFGDVVDLPAGLAGPIIVDANVDWPNDVAVTGDMTILGILNLNATTLTVVGDVSSSGSFIVPSGGVVSITGMLTLGAGSDLDVDGTVTATLGCVDGGATITGTGTHPCGSRPPATFTWIGGADPDPFDWNDPSNWSPPGVPGAGDDVVVQGAATNPVLGSDSEVANIIVGNPNSVDLAGYTLTVSGDVDANANGILNGLVHVTGTAPALRGAFTNLRLSAYRALTGELYVLGDLLVEDVFDTNGQLMSVTGDLSVVGPAARFLMNDAAATVSIFGNALFNGADHTGALTEGYLSLLGDLSVTDASPTAFVSSGNHFVNLSGVSQTVSFDVPGATQQRFGDVTVSTPSGLTLATDARAAGDVTLSGYMIVPAGTSTTIDGTLTLLAGSILQVDGTVVAGSCIDQGAIIIGAGTQPCGAPASIDRVWVGGTTGSESSWAEPRNWAPAGVPTASESVLITYTGYTPLLSSDQSVGALSTQAAATLDLGTFTLSVAGDLTGDGFVTNGLVELTGPGGELSGYVDDLLVSADRSVTGLLTTGDLFVEARLAIQDQAVSVAGELFVRTDAGELVMDNLSGSVYVFGNATFDGASLDGDLTDGFLYFAGDLTANTTNSPTSFKSTGTAVYFLGEFDQTITLANPGAGAGGQSFEETWFGSSGVVTLQSNVFATGDLYATGQTLRQGGTSTLEVQGTLNLSTVTFDGLPLRLVSSVAPDLHVLADVTFTNMATNVAQLFVDLPGADVTSPLLLANPVFNTPPQSGFGYYIEAFNSFVGGPLLLIQLSNPTPPAAAPPLYKVDLNTRILWGP